MRVTVGSAAPEQQEQVKLMWRSSNRLNRSVHLSVQLSRIAQFSVHCNGNMLKHFNWWFELDVQRGKTRHDCDVFYTSDCVSQPSLSILSPALWRTFLKRKIKRLIVRDSAYFETQVQFIPNSCRQSFSRLFLETRFLILASIHFRTSSCSP